jgi:hypothetical protein
VAYLKDEEGNQEFPNFRLIGLITVVTTLYLRIRVILLYRYDSIPSRGKHLIDDNDDETKDVITLVFRRSQQILMMK